MKGDFKNALPWVILLTLVLISAGVSLSVVEGMEMKEGMRKGKNQNHAAH